MLTVSDKIKLNTVIADDFSDEVDGGVARTTVYYSQCPRPQE